MNEITETNRLATPDETKGGYVPVTSAGGPPPGDPALAQHPQASAQSTQVQQGQQQAQAQAQPAPSPQQQTQKP